MFSPYPKGRTIMGVGMFRIILIVIGLALVATAGKAQTAADYAANDTVGATCGASAGSCALAIRQRVQAIALARRDGQLSALAADIALTDLAAELATAVVANPNVQSIVARELTNNLGPQIQGPTMKGAVLTAAADINQGRAQQVAQVLRDLSASPA